MTFHLPAELPVQPTVFFRRCGYAPQPSRRQGELVFAQPIGHVPFPRFHLYVRPLAGRRLVCRLHLDAKAPSYAGVRGHSGEVDTPVVVREGERILSVAHREIRPRRTHA